MSPVERAFSHRFWVSCLYWGLLVVECSMLAWAIVTEQPSWKCWLYAAALVLIGACYLHVQRVWRETDRQLARLRPHHCEMCDSTMTMRVNEYSYCSEHIVEGIARTVRITAIGRGIDPDRIEEAVHWSINSFGELMSSMDPDQGKGSAA